MRRTRAILICEEDVWSVDSEQVGSRCEKAKPVEQVAQLFARGSTKSSEKVECIGYLAYYVTLIRLRREIYTIQFV